MRTIGGHHWIARRVPDNAYVVMPNQLGIDEFDMDDAFGEQREFMCSSDMREFVKINHLDLSCDGKLNPRDAFGSHDDSDHVYNTPRAWYMERYLNPHSQNGMGKMQTLLLYRIISHGVWFRKKDNAGGYQISAFVTFPGEHHMIHIFHMGIDQ